MLQAMNNITDGSNSAAAAIDSIRWLRSRIPALAPTISTRQLDFGGSESIVPTTHVLFLSDAVITLMVVENEHSVLTSNGTFDVSILTRPLTNQLIPPLKLDLKVTCWFSVDSMK